MIGLARLHCYKNGVFYLRDVPQKEKDAQKLKMSREGWIVTHVEFV